MYLYVLRNLIISMMNSLALGLLQICLPIFLSVLNIGMMEDNFLNFATISSEFDLLTVPRKLS